MGAFVQGFLLVATHLECISNMPCPRVIPLPTSLERALTISAEHLLGADCCMTDTESWAIQNADE